MGSLEGQEDGHVYLVTRSNSRGTKIRAPLIYKRKQFIRMLIRYLLRKREYDIMKKISKKVLAVLTCLVFVLSLSAVAFADVSQVLCSGSYNGYNYTGRGQVSGYTARASFNAIENPNVSHVPPSDCTSEAWVLVYDENNKYIGSSNTEGNTSAVASYRYVGQIGMIGCQFEFMGKDLGTYVLFNN